MTNCLGCLYKSSKSFGLGLWLLMLHVVFLYIFTFSVILKTILSHGEVMLSLYNYEQKFKNNPKYKFEQYNEKL